MLDASDADGVLSIRWYDVIGAVWASESTADAGAVRLDAPDDGPQAVVATAK
jgi:hypothetical protein